MGLFREDALIAGITIPAGYPLACSTMSLIYLVGLVIIWFAPERTANRYPNST